MGATSKDYEDADKYFRSEHSKFTGVADNDTDFNFFTENQQIERYSLNYAFWVIEHYKYSHKMFNTPADFAKGYLSRQGLQDSMNKILHRFNKEQRQKILEKAKEIVDHTPSTTSLVSNPKPSLTPHHKMINKKKKSKLQRRNQKRNH